MPIYMNWGNTNPPKIEGGVEALTFEGWIELASAQFRPSNPAGVVITKDYDKSSKSLSAAFLRGAMQSNQDKDLTPPVVIDFIQGGQAGNEDLRLELEWQLDDVVISSFFADPQTHREILTLSVTRFRWGTRHGSAFHYGPPPGKVY